MNSNRRVQLLAICAFAVVILVVVIAISQSGGEPETDVSTDASTVASQLSGIPQDGNVLGDPKAPHTLVEFADLQCPFCKEFSNQTLPQVIDEYVATGQLKLEFQPLTFIGPDSEAAARMALAVGEQGHLWDFVELFYRNQGTENSGYADDDFLTEIAASIEGVDVDEALAARDSDEITAELQAASSQAQDLGVNSTPSFALAAGDEKPQLLDVRSIAPDDFTEQLNGLLSGGG